MASGRCANHVFVTGPPGIGKTTLVRRVTDELRTLEIPVQGFITEEVRSVSDKRTGFDVVTLDGQRGILSRIGSDKPGPRVGQYVVDVKNFEHVALSALDVSQNNKLIVVIDEIGKMELFSQTFIHVVEKLLQEQRVTLFGTIPLPKGKPLALVEKIRRSSKTKIFTLSNGNRDEIVPEVLRAVQMCYKEAT